MVTNNPKCLICNLQPFIQSCSNLQRVPYINSALCSTNFLVKKVEIDFRWPAFDTSFVVSLFRDNEVFLFPKKDSFAVCVCDKHLWSGSLLMNKSISVKFLTISFQAGWAGGFPGGCT